MRTGCSNPVHGKRGGRHLQIAHGLSRTRTLRLLATASSLLHLARAHDHDAQVHSAVRCCIGRPVGDRGGLRAPGVNFFPAGRGIQVTFCRGRARATEAAVGVLRIRVGHLPRSENARSRHSRFARFRTFSGGTVNVVRIICPQWRRHDAPRTLIQRSERKPARRSSTIAPGCSHAAK